MVISLKGYDFDLELQERFNSFFSDIPKTDWKRWFDIQGINDFYELTLKNTGLLRVDDFDKKISTTKTNPRTFSVDIEAYLESYNGGDPLIMCHSSGTTNSDLSKLKWFHIKRNFIEKVWAPGMQAIFESSGLTENGSVVIFVPSRMKFDGIQHYQEKEFYSLYSSEFSQRIMLSIMKPKSYLLYPYKDVYNLDVLLKILKLEDISAISAPAATILKWANISTLKGGIENYLKNSGKESLKEKPTLSLLEKLGLNAVAKEMQSLLSNKLEDATLIFSTSSLNEEKWEKVRTFMNWQKGRERFTNLYVASEIGPFAASLSKDKDKEPSKEEMFIFPLTYPMVEKGNSIKSLEDVKNDRGLLLVSRMNDDEPLININSGDIIELKSQEGWPEIGGSIIRNNFSLSYPVKISDNAQIPSQKKVFVGDFFDFESFQISNARGLLNCLTKEYDLKSDALLLVKDEIQKGYCWNFYIPTKNHKNLIKKSNLISTISKCNLSASFIDSLKNELIDPVIINEDPVQFDLPREKILDKVRSGELTKGILKKWPLYVILPEVKKSKK
ncbi:MAG: hypothetical protein BAJALOKI2v1_50031 [Promethearchaeota archaeon]|nr:MAG: hypothetical protein BAJALOKI2v1_50031 [Candidatus Lokiarchaeota archaeon]